MEFSIQRIFDKVRSKAELERPVEALNKQQKFRYRYNLFKIVQTLTAEISNNNNNSNSVRVVVEILS